MITDDSPDGLTPDTSATLSLTPEELIKKLRRALGENGDFPASAKVVHELRKLAGDPSTTANQVTEIILQEPSLGMRVLRLVNSSFYNRGNPIMTVSQAVVRIGMTALTELCAGLILLQKFVPASRRDSSFAACLKKMILTSLLTSGMTDADGGSNSSSSKTGECGYLAGTLAEIGNLLLAYYFPQIYQGALERAKSKKQPLSKAIAEITGVSSLKLSLEVMDALQLPDFYKQALTLADAITSGAISGSASPAGPAIGAQVEVMKMAKSIAAAQSLSETLSGSSSQRDVDQTLASVSNKLGVEGSMVKGVLGQLGDKFKAHCSYIDITLASIPEFVSDYSAKDGDSKQRADDGPTNDPFKQFMDEIRSAVESREATSSVITTVMESLCWGMKFDRVLLLLVAPTRSALQGRMLLGAKDGIDPKTIVRTLGPSSTARACDIIAFREARPVFSGLPVLEGGWPVAALPIGSGAKTIGIIYADRCSGADTELSPQEQAAIGVIVDLLERSVNAHA